MSGKPKRRGLFFPLLLVGLGVFLLLINLGVVPGTTRDNILMYWPAILILAGLDGLWRRTGLVWPIMLLGLGTLLLLGNLDYLSVSALPLLGKIWPILLVAIGIDIAFGRQDSVWYVALRVVLGIVVVGLILWLAMAFPTAVGTRVVNFEQTLDDAQSSRIELNLVGGQIGISGGAEEDQLIAGKAVLPRYTSLAPVYSQPVNGKSSLKIETENSNNILAGDQSAYEYNFQVSSILPIDLNTDVVVGELRIDLADTLVQRVDTELALGAQTLSIPCNDGLNVQMDQALGYVTLYIPAGCNVNIHLDNALVSTTIPTGWQRQDNLITNPDASNQEGTVDVRIGVAIGAVSIRESD
jgi:hypothetical protein